MVFVFVAFMVLVGNNELWLSCTEKCYFLKRYLITSEKHGRRRAQNQRGLEPGPKTMPREFSGEYGVFVC